MKPKNNSAFGLARKYKVLPRGILQKVADNHKVSYEYVSKIKRGERNNIAILASIVEELERYEADQKELKERINRL